LSLFHLETETESSLRNVVVRASLFLRRQRGPIYLLDPISRFRRETETESNLRNVVDIVLWALFGDNHTSWGGPLAQACFRSSWLRDVLCGLEPTCRRRGNSSFSFLSPETAGSSSVLWIQVSRLWLETDTESSPRNVMF
jgi:hypothetical protein